MTTPLCKMESLTEHLALLSSRIEFLLSHTLSFSHPLQLHEAMRYSSLNGGKRLRPLLIYLCSETLGLSLEEADPIACAIELIHCYSLIHDDLPAMDNADLRRGKPSCHKQYDEACAILTGDALLTYAFEIIAKSPQLCDSAKVKCIQHLAHYAGPEGAVRGQALDLSSTNKVLTESELRELCLYKTGKLLVACVHLPCLAKGLNPDETARLIHYAECLGLAYQLQDDILDIESNTEALGKMAGIDKVNAKNTFPSILGLAETQKKLQDLRNEALLLLQQLPFPSQALIDFTHILFEREY